MNGTPSWSLGSSSAVKVHRSRLGELVFHHEPDAVTLAHANLRTGHLAIVRPARDELAGLGLPLNNLAGEVVDLDVSVELWRERLVPPNGGFCRKGLHAFLVHRVHFFCGARPSAGRPRVVRAHRAAGLALVDRRLGLVLRARRDRGDRQRSERGVLEKVSARSSVLQHGPVRVRLARTYARASRATVGIWTILRRWMPTVVSGIPSGPCAQWTRARRESSPISCSRTSSASPRTRSSASTRTRRSRCSMTGPRTSSAGEPMR